MTPYGAGTARATRQVPVVCQTGPQRIDQWAAPRIAFRGIRIANDTRPADTRLAPVCCRESSRYCTAATQYVVVVGGNVCESETSWPR